MYKARHITTRLKTLTDHFPAVVVVGARQVGKSTLVQHVFGKTADYVLFDAVSAAENARQEPDLFLDNHPQRPLILDEIQYAPELVSAIKRRIDQDRRPGQYILTGSQQWSVMKSISESLAGRAVFLDLEGFSLHESVENSDVPWLERWMSDPNSVIKSRVERLELDHTLNETLWRGSLPDATLLPLDVIGDFHEAYLRTYIERDARGFADVSDWYQFGRFLRLMAALSSQEINFSQLGRELGISPKTAGRWLMILKATFQWFEIPPYVGNAIKRISKKPKGYLADTGMMCHAQEISSPNAISAHPLWGAVFETAVMGQIRKQISLINTKPRVYYWLTLRGAEVDILLERDATFYPIEVKAASQPARSDTRGITAFRRTYPDLTIAPGLVICPCERFMKISDYDYALPWDAI